MGGRLKYLSALVLVAIVCLASPARAIQPTFNTDFLFCPGAGQCQTPGQVILQYNSVTGLAEPVNSGNPLEVVGSGGGGSVIVIGPTYRGNGTLTASSSATISSLIYNNANGVTWASLATSVGSFTIRVLGSIDVAVCVKGGTCTCPENSATATTNGITVYGNNYYPFSATGVTYSVPTIVECSGSGETVEVDF